MLLTVSYTSGRCAKYARHVLNYVRHFSNNNNVNSKTLQEPNDPKSDTIDCSNKDQTKENASRHFSELNKAKYNMLDTKVALDNDSSSKNQLSHESHTQFEISRNKSLWVPHIASTEHVDTEDIHLEGLFAGFKPLFLGESSLPRAPSVNSRNFYKTVEDDNLSPLVPWNITIGGLLQNDRGAVKNIPKEILEKLQPFELTENSDDQILKDELIKMKFHNSSVNDRLDVINMFENYQRKPKSVESAHDWKRYQDRQRNLKHHKMKYQNDREKIVYQNFFIKDDILRIQSEIRKLEKKVITKFYKVTGLKLQQNEVGNFVIPLSMYMQTNICSQRTLRNLIFKTINARLKSILGTLLPNMDSKESAAEYESQIQSVKNQVVDKLLLNIPSESYYNPTYHVKSLILSSPVPGFKRMTWFNIKMRERTFNKILKDKEYMYLNKYGKFASRRGSRVVHYPICIENKKIDEAFEDWRYFTKLAI